MHEGSENWDFIFNDETRVVGVQEGVAGLTANEGVRVTVECTSQGDMHTAHVIRVDA